MSDTPRHPSRLSLYSEGGSFYPRELLEKDGILYFINEDGTETKLNITEITTIQDANGNEIGVIKPDTGGIITIPIATNDKFGLVALSNSSPKNAGIASAGSALDVSRADHVHPEQTDISGNAATANKLKDAVNINGTSFDGSNDISIPLTGFGVNASADELNYVKGVTSKIQDQLNSKIASSLKGSANGIAELDSTGKVPSTQLPSYVDDVIEGYYNNNSFYEDSSYTKAITGESGKIYVDLNTNKTYRWGGSSFAIISDTITIGTTENTAFRGDHGKTAYDHSQSPHAPIDAEENVIDSVSVNGSQLSISNKNVNISVPTKVSELSNDSGFVSTDTTYTVVTASTDGLVPKFDAADGTIDNQTSDWVLTKDNGGTIGWQKLPENAFKNDNTTYTNLKLGQGYGTCTTAASTVAKVATLTGYVLSIGGIAVIKFTNAVPASATLNINSAGAKSIYYKGSAITAGVIQAGDTVSFIYNGSYYHIISIDRDDNTTYSVATSSANGLMSANDKLEHDALRARVAGYALTAGSSSAYTATIDGVALTEGTMIALRFHTSNSISATLNINNLGAKPIYHKGSVISASKCYTNSVILLVYDTTQVSTGAWHCVYSYDSNTTYTNASLGQGYGTCTTAASTAPYVVTLSSYALITGGVVAVKFTYAVRAGATMNINNKGAKAIYYRGSAITEGVIQAGTTALFMYNGSYYHLLAMDKDNKLTHTTDISGTSADSLTSTGFYYTSNGPDGGNGMLYSDYSTPSLFQLYVPHSTYRKNNYIYKRGSSSGDWMKISGTSEYTLIFAARNSCEEDKAKADIVLTGTDDRGEIMDAIKSLTAGSDITLYFCSGTYNLNIDSYYADDSDTTYAAIASGYDDYPFITKISGAGQNTVFNFTKSISNACYGFYFNSNPAGAIIENLKLNVNMASASGACYLIYSNNCKLNVKNVTIYGSCGSNAFYPIYITTSISYTYTVGSSIEDCCIDFTSACSGYCYINSPRVLINHVYSPINIGGGIPFIFASNCDYSTMENCYRIKLTIQSGADGNTVFNNKPIYIASDAGNSTTKLNNLEVTGL